MLCGFAVVNKVLVSFVTFIIFGLLEEARQPNMGWHLPKKVKK